MKHLKYLYRFTGYVPVSLIIVLTFTAGAVFGYLLMSPLGKSIMDQTPRSSVTPTLIKFDDDKQNFKSEIVKTGLELVELVRIPIGSISGGGGAITSIGNYILFATPKGKLGYLRSGPEQNSYEIKFTDARVPMKYADLKESQLWKNPLFNRGWFRTIDLLPLARPDGAFDLYVSHHRFAGTCIEFVVSRVVIRVSKATITVDKSTWADVFVAKPCIETTKNHVFAGHQSGGRLAKGSYNTLLVSLGDYKFDGTNDSVKAPMDPRSHLGKLVEINIDTKQVTIFASGLRNPQGLFVSSDGLVWETEHGPRGGDEVNILQRDHNYGWPEVSYGLPYILPKGSSEYSLGRHEGFTKPVFTFFSSIGVSNLIEIAGDEFPLWRGDLLVTSLKDMAIWRLRRHGDRVIYSERIPLRDRLRDIHELSDGRLALLTDSGTILIIWQKNASQTKLAQISVSGFGSAREVFSDAPEANESAKSGDPRSELFENNCAACHSLSLVNMEGPHLSEIIGRRIGSVEGYPYSEALAVAEGVWTKKLLVNYLSRPQETFFGTTMPTLNLSRKNCRLIVEYIDDYVK